MKKYMKKITKLSAIALGIASSALLSITAFAEEESSQDVAVQQAGPAQWITTLLPLIAFVAIAYFLMIRPEKKRKKEAEEKRASLKVGYTVTTTSGVTGVVTSITDEDFTLSNGITFKRWALYTIDSETDATVNNPAVQYFDEDDLKDE